jgi:hypothetical protein
MNTEAIERVARAIEGPFLELRADTSKYTLDELREIRWRMLDTQKQDFRKMQAAAALSSIQLEDVVETLSKCHEMFRVRGNHFMADMCRTTLHTLTGAPSNG